MDKKDKTMKIINYCQRPSIWHCSVASTVLVCSFLIPLISISGINGSRSLQNYGIKYPFGIGAVDEKEDILSPTEFWSNPTLLNYLRPYRNKGRQPSSQTLFSESHIASENDDEDYSYHPYYNLLRSSPNEQMNSQAYQHFGGELIYKPKKYTITNQQISRQFKDSEISRLLSPSAVLATFENYSPLPSFRTIRNAPPGSFFTPVRTQEGWTYAADSKGNTMNNKPVMLSPMPPPIPNSNQEGINPKLLPHQKSNDNSNMRIPMEQQNQKSPFVEQRNDIFKASPAGESTLRNYLSRTTNPNYMIPAVGDQPPIQGINPRASPSYHSQPPPPNNSQQNKNFQFQQSYSQTSNSNAPGNQPGGQTLTVRNFSHSNQNIINSDRNVPPYVGNGKPPIFQNLNTNNINSPQLLPLSGAKQPVPQSGIESRSSGQYAIVSDPPGRVKDTLGNTYVPNWPNSYQTTNQGQQLPNQLIQNQFKRPSSTASATVTRDYGFEPWIPPMSTSPMQMQQQQQQGRHQPIYGNRNINTSGPNGYHQNPQVVFGQNHSQFFPQGVNIESNWGMGGGHRVSSSSPHPLVSGPGNFGGGRLGYDPMTMGLYGHPIPRNDSNMTWYKNQMALNSMSLSGLPYTTTSTPGSPIKGSSRSKNNDVISFKRPDKSNQTLKSILNDDTETIVFQKQLLRAKQRLLAQKAKENAQALKYRGFVTSTLPPNWQRNIQIDSTRVNPKNSALTSNRSQTMNYKDSNGVGHNVASTWVENPLHQIDTRPKIDENGNIFDPQKYPQQQFIPQESVIPSRKSNGSRRRRDSARQLEEFEIQIEDILGPLTESIA